jgi:hypothetical protein
MQRLRRKILLAGMAALLTAFMGCTAHPSRGVYRLSEINSQYFLLSPDAAHSQGEHQTLLIPRARKGDDPHGSLVSDCSIKGPWFSFYQIPGSNSWTAETPAAPAWERSGGTVDMEDEWQTFERAFYGLQQRRCFSSPHEYLFVKQRIAASLSAPAGDTLFYRYGYGPGGYVDLAPGMQVRIERDIYGSHSSAPARSTDYQGTTITSYEVAANVERETKLIFLRTDKKSSGATAPAVIASDATLATQFAATSHLRLFLQDLVISGNAKTPAILIGASNHDDLNAVTREIENKPQISCTDLLRRQVSCAFFDGTVTVSPLLQVVLNGAPTYVPIGSKLWFILPQVKDAQQARLLRTLRVERPFQGKTIEVEFARTEAEISQLLLLGGDRISWSRSISGKRQ